MIEAAIENLLTGNVPVRKIVLSGKLTIGDETRKLRQWIEDAIQEKALHVMLDVGNLTFIDSCGLGMLVMVNHKLKSYDGALFLTKPSPEFMRVLENTKLLAIFEVVQS